LLEKSINLILHQSNHILFMQNKNLFKQFTGCNAAYKAMLKIICVLSIVAMSSQSFAQEVRRLSMSAIYSRLDSFNARLPAEKLYLQLDKSHYVVGDTIWFKSYLLDGITHSYGQHSGVLYIELISDSSKLIQRISIPLKLGLGYGQLVLNAPLLTEGPYTLRAYTNWMQNFGDTYFFAQRLYIASTGEHLLVKENHKVTDKAGDRNIDFSLQFSDANYKQLAMHDFELRVTDGKRTWPKNKFTTGVDGTINFSFLLPSKYDHKNLSLLVEGSRNSKLGAIIPITINSPQSIDLQFMPEGGHLVAGITSLIGFKAISEDGLAVDVQGAIVDSKNKQVAVFKSVHKGMGSFKLNPVAGETYLAILNLPEGKQKNYNLPKANEEGTVLQVENDAIKDSLLLTLYVSPGMVNNQTCHLLGLARGVTCYGAKLILKQNTIEAHIAKSLFPTGIAHFVILEDSGRPINERVVFIDRHDNLLFDFKADDRIYHPHDSIPVSIKVTDARGKPVTGSFSLAVTDNGQVKADSSNNIVSNILLTSDLKGSVEDAGWYFGNDQLKELALDDLMLTQGWVGYDWKSMLKDNITAVYKPEPEFGIGGRVMKLINSPLKNAKIVLFSPAINFIRDTVSNQKGQFMFTHLPQADTIDYVIQATKKGGGNYGVDLSVDEFKPAAIVKMANQLIKPWYVNSDTTALKLSDNRRNYQQEKDKMIYGVRGRVLKEVVIKSTKIIKGSQNLNGPGQADLVFDEDDLLKVAKKSLLRLLQEKVKDFRLGTHVFVAHATPVYSNVIFRWYFINDKFVLFIVDGIPLYKSIPINSVDDITTFLQSHNAEDVKGIEINYSKIYASNYEARYGAGNILVQLAFIEITTRTGKGNIYNNTPGVYHYRPIPLTMAKQFYQPKYTTITKSTLPDLRSTIHWDPNIITDENGEARISFYAADQPTSYTLILQGTDLKGNLGFKTATINVK
jgi:hypothetical protein